MSQKALQNAVAGKVTEGSERAEPPVLGRPATPVGLQGVPLRLLDDFFNETSQCSEGGSLLTVLQR